MPRRRVTRLRKFCGLLAGHSAQQAERAAQAATDLVRRWLPEGQEVVDVLHFVLGLGQQLEEHRTGLTATDNRHMHRLQVDRNLREERDALTAEVREGMLQLRDSLNGLFGTGGSNKIFEEAPRIPTDPVALHQLTGHVLDNLGNEEFPMPKPLRKGFKLDRVEAVRDLQQPHRQLGLVLSLLEGTESDSKFSQASKDTDVADVDAFSNKVARYYEALFDLVGFSGLAQRVRRSTHRAASSETETDGPNVSDAGEDDAPESGDGPPQDAQRAEPVAGALGAASG